MAIAHIRITSQSRANGDSAVAKAAYDSCSSLSAAGEVYDYRRKRGLVHAEMIYAPGVEAQTRGDYWRAVEAAERRVDACVSRELEGSLPNELDAAQRLALARDIAEQVRREYDFAAVDLCLHCPPPDRRKRKRGADMEVDNNHFHLHIPTRNREGKKIRKFNGLSASAEIKKIRKLYETTTNKHLEAAGLKTRISVATLEEQLEASKAEIARYDLSIDQWEFWTRELEEEARTHGENRSDQAEAAANAPRRDRAADGRQARSASSNHRSKVRRDAAEHRRPVERDSPRPGQVDGWGAPRDGRRATRANALGTGDRPEVERVRAQVADIRSLIRAYATQVDRDAIRAAWAGEEVEQRCQQTYRPR